jgi:putative transposase
VLKATWQPCKVHFLRNALAHAGKGQRQMVLAMINTVFAQENLDAAIAQWRVVADQLRDRFPRLAAMLDTSEPDVLAYMSFPKPHRTQIHSTNPLEGLNAEIKGRTDFFGIFPNEAAITRLVGALLEQSDEWSLQRRDMQLEGLQMLVDNQTPRLSAVVT